MALRAAGALKLFVSILANEFSRVPSLYDSCPQCPEDADMRILDISSTAYSGAEGIPHLDLVQMLPTFFYLVVVKQETLRKGPALHCLQL